MPHLPLDEGDEVWNKLLAYYTFNRSEFDKFYHKRSNVESSIGAIKAKLQEKLRSKTGTGMVNEALLKVLAYNVTRLVHSFYELGVDLSCFGLEREGNPVLAGITAGDLW